MAALTGLDDRSVPWRWIDRVPLSPGVMPGAPGTPPGEPQEPVPPPEPTEAPPEAGRDRQVDRTRTGVLLLFVGLLLLWIPVANLAGGVVILVGAVLVILGRKAFGPAHQRNVLVSLGLYLFGFVGSLVLFLLFQQAVGGFTPDVSAEARLATINGYVLAFLVMAAIASLSYVLFTYALQEAVGKRLLWAAYGVLLVLLGVAYFLITGFFRQMAEGTADTGALLIQASLVLVSFVVAYALFAVAYYLAYARIKRGELPA